jgi:membrane protein YdbS with pleckstrin-like domain
MAGRFGFLKRRKQGPEHHSLHGRPVRQGPVRQGYASQRPDPRALRQDPVQYSQPRPVPQPAQQRDVQTQQPIPLQPAPRAQEPAQQPIPATPGFQAIPGKETKIMKFSRSRRGGILLYFIGLILLLAAGYVFLFRPVQIAAASAFISFDYVAMSLALLGIIVALFAEAKQRGARYYITQYRVVEVWGLLRKREHAIQLSQIEGVRTQQSFFHRILGIGDVEVKTGRDSITLFRVSNPGKVESVLLSELNRSRGYRSQ